MTHELLKIGNSEVTKSGIEDLQRLYEAQTKAEKALPALIDFQAAGKACERHGWIDVAYLMSLPVQVRGKALKDAVDEAVEAFSGQQSRTQSSDALPVWSFLTAAQKAESWTQYNFDGVEPQNVTFVLFADGSSNSNKDGQWRWPTADKIWGASPEFTIIGYKADADELNDLFPHEGEEEEDAFESLNKAADVIWKSAAEIDAPAYETVTGTETDFPPMPEGEGWEKNAGKQPFDAWVEVDTVTFGGDTDTCDCGLYLWEFQDSENDIAWYRKAQQDAPESVEREAEPAPAPERKFKAGDRVRCKLRSENGTVTGYTEMGSVEFQIDGREHTSVAAEDELEFIVDHAAEATAQIEASIDEREEAAASAYEVGQRVSFEDDDGAKLSGEITHVGQDYSSHEPWYNIKASDGETYVQVDHDEVTLIEAQAEPESTETMEAHQRFDRNGTLLKAGDHVTSSEMNLSGILDEWEEWRENLPVRDGVAITLVNPAQLEKVEAEAEPDTAETMQAIAEAVEAVDVEAQTPATPDETVTEQPETVEAEPEAPAEPKAERKSYDFTGDFTQEEILAQSGATAPAVQNQPDDIAATERAEFDAPRRQFYNPWNTTAKAEG